MGDYVFQAGVCFSISISSDYECQTFVSLGKPVDECEEYGIPVIVSTVVGKEIEKRDAKHLALYCRIVAELGAKVSKTYW